LTHLKLQTLKPGHHSTGARLETRALSKLWVNWIQQLYSPTEGTLERLGNLARNGETLGVGAPVADARALRGVVVSLEGPAGLGHEVAEVVVVPPHRPLARGRRGGHERAKLRLVQPHPRVFQPCGEGTQILYMRSTSIKPSLLATISP
jgi:hypothetical protein